MSGTWGLETAERPQPQEKRPLPPKAARAGHKGIVWIHAAAIAIWLLTGAILAIVWMAGREVPDKLVLACFLAAAGHGLFVAVHLYLAKAAASRALAQSQK